MPQNTTEGEGQIAKLNFYGRTYCPSPPEDSLVTYVGVHIFLEVHMDGSVSREIYEESF